MRERLKRLIDDLGIDIVLTEGEKQHIADHLLAEGVIVPPCKVGEIVYVDVDTLPYNYLHPLEIDGKFALCQVITMIIGKTQTCIKMAALYPTRCHRRNYLKYPISAIGKTVFLTREEAEKALERIENGKSN